MQSKFYAPPDVLEKLRLLREAARAAVFERDLVMPAWLRSQSAFLAWLLHIGAEQLQAALMVRGDDPLKLPSVKAHPPTRGRPRGVYKRRQPSSTWSRRPDLESLNCHGIVFASFEIGHTLFEGLMLRRRELEILGYTNQQVADRLELAEVLFFESIVDLGLSEHHAADLLTQRGTWQRVAHAKKIRAPRWWWPIRLPLVEGRFAAEEREERRERIEFELAEWRARCNAVAGAAAGPEGAEAELETEVVPKAPAADADAAGAEAAAELQRGERSKGAKTSTPASPGGQGDPASA